MLRSTDEFPFGEEPYGSTAEADTAEDEVANFIVLALHQIIQRIGWIFKTESIVMPAFMDFIGGGPVLRGCLPLLNRFGFAVPPVLFARTLKNTPRKKWAVAACTFGLSVPFATLSVLWFSGTWRSSDGVAHDWLPWLFLLLYGLFFALMGMNQLASHTLQGKLIRADRRGRLLTIATITGAPLAVVAAWFTMPHWLAMEDGGFAWIFGVPALMFVLASVTLVVVRELPDAFYEPSAPVREHFREAYRIVSEDRHFRQLAIVATLFGASFMVFPHYQALGRERLGLAHGNLMLWVCAQNVATAAASLLAGPLADRFGNRAALNVSVLSASLAPLLALGMSFLHPATARPLFWLVFLPIGMTPITIKLLANYTLEIADREHHPRYVSTVGMCLAVPVILGAPLVGWLVRIAGYPTVFAGAAIAVGCAGLMTFRLTEPRHW